jgi:hypothetical protein
LKKIVKKRKEREKKLFSKAEKEDEKIDVAKVVQNGQNWI